MVAALGSFYWCSMQTYGATSDTELEVTFKPTKESSPLWQVFKSIMQGAMAVIGEADTKVIMCLLSHSDWQSCECYPSIPTIMKETSLSHTAVVSSIKRLKDLGFVRIGKKPVRCDDGKTRMLNLYVILTQAKRVTAATSVAGATKQSPRRPQSEVTQATLVASNVSAERIMGRFSENVPNSQSGRNTSGSPVASSGDPTDLQDREVIRRLPTELLDACLTTAVERFKDNLIVGRMIRMAQSPLDVKAVRREIVRLYEEAGGE